MGIGHKCLTMNRYNWYDWHRFGRKHSIRKLGIYNLISSLKENFFPKNFARIRFSKSDGSLLKKNKMILVYESSINSVIYNMSYCHALYIIICQTFWLLAACDKLFERVLISAIKWIKRSIIFSDKLIIDFYNVCNCYKLGNNKFNYFILYFKLHT